MTTFRLHSSKLLLLIGLAVIIALLSNSTSVQAQANTAATGLPRVVVSAEGPGILGVDTWDIRDADGLPYGPPHAGTTDVGGPADGQFTFAFNYQWIRVDGGTEVNVGADSPRYQLSDADFGKKFKVRVSFTDRANNAEAVTSVPFGPIARPVSLPSPTTLVANTGETAGLATTVITSDLMDPSDYAIGFNLGDHGQGYEISSVSIDLAAVPSSLSVSLWTSGVPGSSGADTRRAKLFEFENPDSFAVGLNEFTAPAGVYALQARKLWIVLSGFGSSLSIKEISSDDQDSPSVSGALIDNEAGGNTNVLRLDIKGRTRTVGILAANLAQPKTEGNQEIISVGDEIGWTIKLGSADRFLVRGMALSGDDTTLNDGGFDDPWYFRSSFDGTSHFRMFQTRNVNGLPTWTAPQGATVPGDSTYVFQWAAGQTSFTNDGAKIERIGAVLHRSLHVDVAADGNSDVPSAAGTTLGKGGAISDNDADGPTPLMVVYGVPLYTVVKNLGQTDNGHVSVGGTNDVVSQGFTTGSRTGGYALPGIGVNIEGSKVSGTSQIPADASAVSVSVHADSSGAPGAKLFDLLSPTEYAAGHSFFEAPRGARLDASTSYVLVWRHNSGANHRLVKTTGNSEDSGAEPGASIANAFRLGSDVATLTQDSSGNALEITVYTGQPPSNATGRPVILPTAEDHGVLAVDTSGISDMDGIPNVGALDSTGVLRNFRYRWIRVDGGTETVVGADSVDYRQIVNNLAAAGHRIESGRYRLVEEDFGKLLRVEVSFFDEVGTSETVSSLPFRPVREPPRRLPESTLVSNTGQSPSAQATITNAPYRMGFKLASHGQGYEISGVSIDLAAAPSSLTVSLWMGRAPGSGAAGAQTKLFEFENPPSFKVGLNEFKAPPAAFAYQNVDYFIVLSDFGDSLSIMQTTSDAEDARGETGATLANVVDGGDSVLRLAVKGWRRDHGILVSTYGQEQTKRVYQEIVSLSDEIGVKFTVGAADRYLIRGATFSADNAELGGGYTSPWSIRDGTDELFKLISTHQISGINEWTAHQGATVAGGCTTVMSVETCKEYNFYMDIADPRVGGVVLMRMFGTSSTNEDEPKAAGVTIGDETDDLGIGTVMDPGRLLMAIFGEPLEVMVQNLGQTDESYRSVGSSTTKVAVQAFTAGSDEFGYRLQGIGVNIEGSDDSNGDPQVPDGSASVLVSVHADSGGNPGKKLFDLISPTEFGAGHSFFEAPRGAYLDPDTSYQLVWRHVSGTWHRLQLTDSASEDSGALTGSSIGNDFRRGANTGSLSRETGKALELAVYTEVNTRAPFVEGGIPVPLSWLHIPDGAYAGYQFRALYVTHHAINAEDDDVEFYNDLVQFEASGRTRRYPEASGRLGDPIIRRVADQFKAVVCTAADKNARKNTDMTGIGVPVHWLDGGSQHRDTLVANSNSQFFGPEWVQDEWGAHVTGNSTPLFEISVDEATRGDKVADMIWTGCDSTGMAHSDYHLGSAMGMATLGTPADESAGNAPIGPTASNTGMVAFPVGEYRSIYAISPVFTVVGGVHSILPPRNVRGEVDENTRALTLSWDPPGGYEEVDLRYNIWWRSGGAWETVKTKRARLDPAQFDTGANRNHGYSETESAGSLSATTFDYGGVTYTVRTLIDQRLIADSTETADLFLRLSPQPTAALDAALTLAFDNGDSVDLDNATRTDTAADTVNNVPAYSFYTWVDEGIEFQEGVPVLFNFYDGNGNALIDSQTGVVVDGTTWTDDRSDRTYGVQAIDAEGRTSPRVDYVCSERTGCVIPGG